MKISYLLPLLFFFVSTLSFSQTGENIISRNIDAFDRLEVAGPFNVHFDPSLKGKIQITSKKLAHEKIITEVKNRTLNIRLKKDVFLRLIGHNSIQISIPQSNVSAVSLSGSGKILSVEPITNKKLDTRLAGSGKIELTVNTSNVDCQLSGSGKISLKGETEDLKVKLAGSGHLKLEELHAKNATARLSGSGKILLHCTETLNANVAGSGNIRYYGNPSKKIHSNVSGSGSIRKSN